MPATKREPVVVQSLAIAVPPARAWQALTSPRDLEQIVLGKVEMGEKPGAPFRWEWPIWRAMAPRRGSFEWRGHVLDAVPGTTLVLGPAPVATFTVKGEGASTLLTVVQGGPVKGIEDYEHGWADWLLKLKTLLETEHARNEVLLRALLRATPQQVYRAWLDPKTLAKVIPGKAKVSAKAGGRFAWQHKLSRHVHAGTFLELEKNRTIACTWEGTKPVSEVRVGIGAAPFGTLVSLQHTGLLGMNPGQLFGQRAFWNRLLERLRCFLFFKGRVRAR